MRDGRRFHRLGQTQKNSRKTDEPRDTSPGDSEIKHLIRHCDAYYLPIARPEEVFSGRVTSEFGMELFKKLDFESAKWNDRKILVNSWKFNLFQYRFELDPKFSGRPVRVFRFGIEEQGNRPLKTVISVDWEKLQGAGVKADCWVPTRFQKVSDESSDYYSDSRGSIRWLDLTGRTALLPKSSDTNWLTTAEQLFGEDWDLRSWYPTGDQSRSPEDLE